MPVAGTGHSFVYPIILGPPFNVSLWDQKSLLDDSCT